MSDLMNAAIRSLTERGMQSCTDYQERMYSFHDPLFFVANLKEEDGTLRFVYGCAFMNRMDGWIESHTSLGFPNDDCALRIAARVTNQVELNAHIDEAFSRYAEWERIGKDAILAQVKKQRKAFKQNITDRLKPLGFKKKSNRWIIPFHERFTFEFYAQKSGYSDKYYFRMSLLLTDDVHGRGCYYHDVTPGGYGAIDWQLIDPDALNKSLDDTLRDYILPMLTTDLTQLGKRDWIQKACSCSREFCEDCWVEKNLWEYNAKNLVD